MKKIIFILWIIMHSCVAYSFSLYGHRGARGLAPENTLPAYQIALKQHVNYVDMDIMMTKDHILVVQHDFTLNPDITRDKKGHWIKSKNILIKNLTLKELQSYDVGRIKPHTKYAALFPSQHPVDHTHIPTLKEVLQYVKKTTGNQVGFQIEIKTDPAHPEFSYSPDILASALANIIKKENITNRTQVQAFDWRCLLALQKINPEIATAYLTYQSEKLDNGLWTAGRLLQNFHNSLPQMIKSMGGRYWDPEDIEVNFDNLQEAHQLGLKVVVWSWPEKSKKEIDVPLLQKLSTLGVDGIITDRPDLTKKITP